MKGIASGWIFVLVVSLNYYLTSGLSVSTGNFALLKPSSIKIPTCHSSQYSLQRSRLTADLRGGSDDGVKRSATKKTKSLKKNLPKSDRVDWVSNLVSRVNKKVNTFPLMGMITNRLVKTPPITKYILGSSIALTFGSFLLNGNEWPSILNFEPSSILFGQVWRLVSPFLYFGQLDLFYPLTIEFVWQYMASLERLSSNDPGEFLAMLLFGGGTMLALYSLLGISTRYLGHNLATFLLYIWARMFEGQDVNYMGLFTLKSELLPWFFCAHTFLLEQEIPVADLLGIFAGNFYFYARNKGLVQTPSFIKQIFESEHWKKQYEKFRMDLQQQ